MQLSSILPSTGKDIHLGLRPNAALVGTGARISESKRQVVYPERNIEGTKAGRLSGGPASTEYRKAN